MFGGLAMSVNFVIDTAFKAAIVFSWIYGAYHFWLYNKLLAKAIIEGRIVPELSSGSIGFGWMIASPGVVPGGDPHRLKSMCGIAAFVALCAAYALFSAIFWH
jgi:hypothetical protein